MFVEMMRPDASKSAAIATFEALCNFWRTFRWLVDTRPKLRGRVGVRLSNFVKDESFRRTAAVSGCFFGREQDRLLMFFGLPLPLILSFPTYRGTECRTACQPFPHKSIQVAASCHEATEVLLTRRHKDRCPDIGALLVLFTVLQGDKSCPSREEFLQHYADENSLRWVMWWQRSNTPPQGAPVFQATQVSREILMFQMTVIEVVIGDVPTTLKDEPSIHPPGGY